MKHGVLQSCYYVGVAFCYVVIHILRVGVYLLSVNGTLLLLSESISYSFAHTIKKNCIGSLMMNRAQKHSYTKKALYALLAHKETST